MRQVLAFPVELVALGVLALRTILIWIFSIPNRIVRWLDKLYYRMVQLRRSIVGEPNWKVIDYTHLGIHPPSGWERISAEDRQWFIENGWVFMNSNACPPMTTEERDELRRAGIINPEVLDGNGCKPKDPPTP